MAGLRTTPSLETVPTEILYLIGSHLRDDEFGSITQASRTLRHVFLPRRYARIKFSGTVKQVSEHLTTMFAMSCDAISMNMRHLIEIFTRFVTFRIHYWRNDSRVPLQFSRSDVKHFDILLHSINRLCGVDFSLEIPTHRDVLAFNKALRKTGLWSTNGDTPFSLTFLGEPEVSNFNAVVRRFEPGTLGAVQLPRGFNRRYYVILKKSSHSQALKALHIDRTENRQNFRRVLPSLEHEILGEVRQDFPQLESLILHEDTPYLDDVMIPLLELELIWLDLVWFDDQLAFDRTVNALATALNRMPRLRRFAFTLWFVRLGGRLVSRDWDEGYRPKSMVELDNFYINNLVSPIMTQVPTLVELCVSSEHPIFYRGIRRDDQSHVQRESRDNPGEENRFPSLLLDLN
ncbi:hypothetical protein FPRO05_09171 [Fusarium proliferatum]|uniref:F-box domain-containing protein n=1 Tax=Gibberella intermedia TaxID=948311 RepID=A0A365NGE2_GIBIN|nr:hypothetical protein FPRO05_09171 [Fusarium proliferatum]